MQSDVFEKVFNLIKASFPENEYRSYENQKKLLDNPNYFINLNTDSNNNILGVICFWRINHFSFIEHFAISPLMRGKGLGSKMLKEFIGSEKSDTIILEVELPKDEISTRRIKFYERNGFKLNTYEYFQMPLRKHSAPIPLYLMSYPKNLSSGEFRNYKSLIYKNVYSIEDNM